MTHSSSIVAFVTQTSHWDQQGKDTTIVAKEEFSWGNPEVGDTDEEGAVEVVGDAGESGVKEGEKLAQLFKQAGVVEIAEVIYNRETDQSHGFGFMMMSTVDEVEKVVEMFHRYLCREQGSVQAERATSCKLRRYCIHIGAPSLTFAVIRYRKCEKSG
ncbi:hypothetical protein LOK49_LG11G00238 [Camellia lanceoleosa]|uniref:Uncharacterized protein n=1 Tax=Camellia lanceoleosa TaxID=1840588 RepID=A0ACC0G047_9ERIC|nr:hypothetical protein LOK49_LG11G00238 [Camellia lanceoleosa]